MSDVISRLLDMLERSVLFQGALSLVLVCSVAYMAIVGQPIPDVLGNLASMAVGFFFGTKTVSAVSRAARGMEV